MTNEIINIFNSFAAFFFLFLLIFLANPDDFVQNNGSSLYLVNVLLR